MKLLIQHNQPEDGISGVLSYIQTTAPVLEELGVELKIISTRCNSARQIFKALRWADLVHMNSNDLGFALTSKLLGKKILLKYHFPLYQTSHFSSERLGFIDRLRAELSHILHLRHCSAYYKLETLGRLAARMTTALLAEQRIACSQSLAESCSLPLPVSCLYNPIAITNAEARVLTSPVSFVFVGRLDTDKGSDLLLKAASQLKDEGRRFQIRIVGKGPEKENLENISKNLSLEACVRFEGKLEQSNIRQILSGALALIAPSRWQDPAPYAVIEASSVGTVSIVTKMGGLPEMAGPSGLLVDPEPGAIAASMRYLIDHPDEGIRRGTEAHSYSLETFAVLQQTAKLQQLCASLIESG